MILGDAGGALSTKIRLILRPAKAGCGAPTAIAQAKAMLATTRWIGTFLPPINSLEIGTASLGELRRARQHSAERRRSLSHLSR